MRSTLTILLSSETYNYNTVSINKRRITSVSTESSGSGSQTQWAFGTKCWSGHLKYLHEVLCFLWSINEWREFRTTLPPSLRGKSCRHSALHQKWFKVKLFASLEPASVCEFVSLWCFHFSSSVQSPQCLHRYELPLSLTTTSIISNCQVQSERASLWSLSSIYSMFHRENRLPVKNI